MMFVFQFRFSLSLLSARALAKMHACTAETAKETKELIEAGFEHVTHMDGVELFRKPK